MKCSLVLGVLGVAIAGLWPVRSFPSGAWKIPHPGHCPIASRLESSRDSSSSNEGNRCFTTHVIASDALILPGEGMTLFLTDAEAMPLLRDSIMKDGDVDCENGGNMGSVVVAVRLMSDEHQQQPQHYQPSSLAQVASLCQITRLHARKKPGEYVQIDLQCTGQVRLLEMADQYNANHYQFKGEYVDEVIQSKTDFEKALRLENKIEVLMKKVSHMEQEIQHEVNEQQRRAEAKQLNHNNRRISSSSFFPMATCLYDQYEAAKANIEKSISKAFQPKQDSSSTTDDDTTLLGLTATSWGVFMCLNDPSLEARYRLRALDWDNLLERIKLAQYALREKQLRLQGRLMELQTTNEVNMNYALDDPNAFQ